MEPTRSIRQSCNILVGVATDELNLERNGKVRHEIAMFRLWTYVRGLVTAGWFLMYRMVKII